MQHYTYIQLSDDMILYQPWLFDDAGAALLSKQPSHQTRGLDSALGIWALPLNFAPKNDQADSIKEKRVCLLNYLSYVE
jgi:hypothetical protein